MAHLGQKGNHQRANHNPTAAAPPNKRPAQQPAPRPGPTPSPTKPGPPPRHKGFHQSQPSSPTGEPAHACTGSLGKSTRAKMYRANHACTGNLGKNTRAKMYRADHACTGNLGKSPRAKMYSTRAKMFIADISESQDRARPILSPPRTLKSTPPIRSSLPARATRTSLGTCQCQADCV